MPKYALYIVLVEDTEESDIAMGTDSPGEEFERIAGNLEYDAARAAMRDFQQSHGNTEKAD